MAPRMTKKKKECVRKTGRNFVNKGMQLAEKTGMFVFAAYHDPTHDRLVAKWHLPKGQTFPDWNEVVNNPEVYSVFPYGQRKRKQAKQPAQRRVTRASTRRGRSEYSFQSSPSPVSNDLDLDQASVSSIADDDMQELPETPSPSRSQAGDRVNDAYIGSVSPSSSVDFENNASFTNLPSGNDGMPKVHSPVVDATTLESTNYDLSPVFDDGELLIFDEENIPALSAHLGGERELSQCIEDVHMREKSLTAVANRCSDRNTSTAAILTKRISAKRIWSDLIEYEYTSSLLW